MKNPYLKWNVPREKPRGKAHISDEKYPTAICGYWAPDLNLSPWITPEHIDDSKKCGNCLKIKKGRTDLDHL